MRLPAPLIAATCLTPVLAASLVACSGSNPQRTVTVTVPPSGSSSSGSGSPTGSGTASATGSASVQAGGQTKLPGTCDDLLSDYSVAQALGAGYTLGGKTSFVVGTAETGIGRLANINCRYGVSGSGSSATTKLEIGVSLYATTTQAATRISSTAADFVSHGAQTTEVVVAGARAQLFTGGTGDGYTAPTLVAAEGQRTIAVTVGTSLATGPTASTDATKAAQLAITKTAG